MKELILALFLFISTETDYNTNNLEVPEIRFLPQVELDAQYTKESSPPGNELFAFYDLKSDIIYLRDSWNIHSPWSKSVLLHELIHYVQDKNNIAFECTAEMEQQAWPLQKKYLRIYHGVTWDYDKLWHLLISTCPPNPLSIILR